MFKKMENEGGSSGDGSLLEDYIVPVYENGKWLNGFQQSDFNFYNVTFEDDCISLTQKPYGIWTNTAYYSQYQRFGMLVSPGHYQYGTCNSTASLPTVCTSGTGRITCRDESLSGDMVFLTFPLSANNGWYLCHRADSGTLKIYGIYLLANEMNYRN